MWMRYIYVAITTPLFFSQIYLWDPPIKICLECQYNFDKSELCHVCQCQVFYLPMAFLSFSNSSTPTIPFFPCNLSTPNVPLNNSTAIFSGQNWTWFKQNKLHSTLIDWKTQVYYAIFIVLLQQWSLDRELR